MSPVGRFIKRAFDIIASGVALLILLPLILAVAIIVRAEIGSPVFFLQVRPGIGAKPFTLYKFRTMRDAVGPDGMPLPDAVRLTKLGSQLRRLTLDELPELVNVLKGDMSIVGPRPLLTEYVPLYTDKQRRRHEVKPGLTGWAVVNGRNSLSWSEKFRLDVWYVDHWTFFLDIRIILQTIASIVRRDGVSASGHATMPRFRGEP